MAKRTTSSSSKTAASTGALSAADLGFLGNHPLNLDNKFRVIVPARFKATLQRKYAGGGSDPITVVATIALERHFRNITVFPAMEWEKYIAQFERMPILDLDTQKLHRLITSVAAPCEMDGQGRIRLDQRLVQLARIDKRVVAVGRGAHFELWDAQRYDEFIEDAINHVDTMADKAMERFGSAMVGGGTMMTPSGA